MMMVLTRRKTEVVYCIPRWGPKLVLSPVEKTREKPKLLLKHYSISNINIDSSLGSRKQCICGENVQDAE